MMTDLQHFQLKEGTSTLKTFEVVAGIPFGGTLHFFGHRYGNFAEYYQAGMASPALTIDRDIDLLLRRQNKCLLNSLEVCLSCAWQIKSVGCHYMGYKRMSVVRPPKIAGA
jgi:hypothetical protein